MHVNAFVLYIIFCQTGYNAKKVYNDTKPVPLSQPKILREPPSVFIWPFAQLKYLLNLQPLIVDIESETEFQTFYHTPQESQFKLMNNTKTFTLDGTSHLKSAYTQKIPDLGKFYVTMKNEYGTALTNTTTAILIESRVNYKPNALEKFYQKAVGNVGDPLVISPPELVNKSIGSPLFVYWNVQCNNGIYLYSAARTDRIIIGNHYELIFAYALERDSCNYRVLLQRYEDYLFAGGNRVDGVINYSIDYKPVYVGGRFAMPESEVRPPKWESAPEDTYNFVSGERIRIVCGASGMPSPRITWTQNGESIDFKALTFYDKKKIKRERGYSWLLSFYVHRRDAGLIKCTASNGIGNDITKEFTIIVTGPPEIKPINFSNAFIVPGSSKTFLIEIVTEETQSSISILKNGKPFNLSQVQGIIVLRHTPLVLEFKISNATAERDEGVYQIKLTNEHGSTVTNFRIIVQGFEPRFPTEFQYEFIGAKGQDIEIYADYFGSPNPSVTWIKNGKTEKESNSAILEKYSRSFFTILNLQSNNSGNYTFRACNQNQEDIESCIWRNLSVYLAENSLTTFQNNSRLYITEKSPSVNITFKIDKKVKKKRVAVFRNGRLYFTDDYMHGLPNGASVTAQVDHDIITVNITILNSIPFVSKELLNYSVKVETDVDEIQVNFQTKLCPRLYAPRLEEDFLSNQGHYPCAPINCVILEAKSSLTNDTYIEQQRIVMETYNYLLDYPKGKGVRYKYRARFDTELGIGPPSKAYIADESEGVPDMEPFHFTDVVRRPTMLLLKWELPPFLWGVVNSDEVHLKINLNGDERTMTVEETECEFLNLTPLTKYIATCQICNIYGCSDAKNIELETAALPPQTSPEFDSFSHLKSNSLRLNIKPFSFHSKSKQFLVSSHRDNALESSKVYNESEPLFFDHLEPSTNYTFKVRGVNEGGNGPLTETPPIVMPPAKLCARLVPLNSAIYVAWTPLPEAKEYHISYKPSLKSFVVKNTNVYKIENLKENTDYEIEIFAVSNAGNGDATILHTTTTLSGPPLKQEGLRADMVDRSLLFSWNLPVNDAPGIESYVVQCREQNIDKSYTTKEVMAYEKLSAKMENVAIAYYFCYLIARNSFGNSTGAAVVPYNDLSNIESFLLVARLYANILLWLAMFLIFIFLLMIAYNLIRSKEEKPKPKLPELSKKIPAPKVDDKTKKKKKNTK